MMRALKSIQLKGKPRRIHYCNRSRFALGCHFRSPNIFFFLLFFLFCVTIESVKYDFMVRSTHFWLLSKRKKTHWQKLSKRRKSIDVLHTLCSITRNWSQHRRSFTSHAHHRGYCVAFLSVGCLSLGHIPSNKPTINRNHYRRTMSPTASTSYSSTSITHSFCSCKKRIWTDTSSTSRVHYEPWDMQWIRHTPLRTSWFHFFPASDSLLNRQRNPFFITPLIECCAAFFLSLKSFVVTSIATTTPTPTAPVKCLSLKYFPINFNWRWRNLLSSDCSPNTQQRDCHHWHNSVRQSVLHSSFVHLLRSWLVVVRNKNTRPRQTIEKRSEKDNNNKKRSFNWN